MKIILLIVSWCFHFEILSMIAEESEDTAAMIKKLEKKSIVDILNTGRYISENESKNIIKYMQTNWDEKNIHILLNLHPRELKDSKILSPENIQLIVDKLSKLTIIDLLNTEYWISEPVSDRIIACITNETVKLTPDNIHILLRLTSASLNNDILSEENIDTLVNKFSGCQTANTEFHASTRVSNEIIKSIEKKAEK